MGKMDKEKKKTVYFEIVGAMIKPTRRRSIDGVTKKMVGGSRRWTLMAACFFIYLLVGICSPHEFESNGKVLELDDSNFDSAISSFDYVFVDFYAPWCGHCKRLSPELDKAVPLLANLETPVVIAKVDADKYRKLGNKYDIAGFPTLMVFSHGVPVEYSGSRKADSIVQYMKKFVGPDVSVLESDSSIDNFIKTAGKDFPIFLGFGLETNMIEGFARKYKQKAWFSSIKDVSEDAMVAYDFDKSPALIVLHPKFNEKSVFYGPFDVDFLEAFIKQSMLPLTLPINYETMKLLMSDERKLVIAIMEDEFNEKSLKLIKAMKAAAYANRDLIFGYIDRDRFESMLDSFEIDTKKLPTMFVWDKSENYFIVAESDRLEEENSESHVGLFLKGYRGGNVVKKTLRGPSFMGYINSLISINTVYIIVFVVAVIMLIQYLSRQEEDEVPRRKREGSDSEDHSENRRQYEPGDKED